MKKYLSVFRIRFTNTLQYRAAALAGIATQFAWGFMEILAFRAFYQSDSAAFPMGFSQLASYIWLQQAFLAMAALWFFDADIFESIASGGIAYELARPVNLYGIWFFKNCGTRLSRTLLRCVPVLTVAFLLPQPWGLSLPPDLFTFACFLVSLALSFFVVVALVMLVYIITLRSLSPLGPRYFLGALSELLSGAIIPLPFFPDGVREAVELLPFASGQNVPLRIYSGNLAGADMGRAMLLQLFWAGALILGGMTWMRLSEKKIVVQGG